MELTVTRGTKSLLHCNISPWACLVNVGLAVFLQGSCKEVALHLLSGVLAITPSYLMAFHLPNRQHAPPKPTEVKMKMKSDKDLKWNRTMPATSLQARGPKPPLPSSALFPNQCFDCFIHLMPHHSSPPHPPKATLQIFFFGNMLREWFAALHKYPKPPSWTSPTFPHETSFAANPFMSINPSNGESFDGCFKCLQC